MRTTWPRALDAVAAGFAAALDAHGPQSIAMYLSGQLLTEDYYVANKLMKGFLGSANVDTNSRLCMASSVAGHRRAFGADVVPGCYDDFDEADLIVFVGSNAAWCHPVLFQRAERAKARRGARIVADRSAPHGDRASLPTCICRSRPARTRSCSAACWSRSPRATPSTAPMSTRTLSDFEQRSRRRAPSRRTARRGGALRPRRRRPRDVPRRCGSATPRVVTAFSQGVNQSAQGTDKVNAILNVHLADRAHRQAGLRSVLADRPAQCDGRARGRRPRQPARRPYGLPIPLTSTACGASGARRRWRRRQG